MVYNVQGYTNSQIYKKVNKMGLGNIGIPSLILIIIIALIVFGPKKLPEIGKAAGQTLKEFKTSANDLITEQDEEKDKK